MTERRTATGPRAPSLVVALRARLLDRDAVVRRVVRRARVPWARVAVLRRARVVRRGLAVVRSRWLRSLVLAVSSAGGCCVAVVALVFSAISYHLVK
ncbi:MAG: hypothetical protein K6T27_05280 [Thermoleophilum sp.]|nr:hypothetical protein [Thermoleophilum sp.]